MKKSGFMLLFAMTIGIVGLIIWLKPNTHQQHPINTAAIPLSNNAPPIVFQSNTTAINPPMKSTVSFTTGLERLPASLSGTEVDGEIIIDDKQNLYVTRRLRNLFDYFLSTVGEESLTTITQRVKAYIRHRTPEPAQSQAIALFDQYIGYRTALRSIPEAGGKSADQIDLEAISQQKAAEQRLRQQFFSAQTIQAFFGDDDAYDQYTLESLKIANNTQLSDAEKARKSAELIQKLPEHLRESMKETAKIQDLEQKTAEWKARNGSAAELRQIRLDLVGIEATERLEAVDQENLQWQRQVDGYLREYHKINSNPQWSAEQKQLMVISLRRQQGFSEEQQLRLPAFEQMAAQDQPSGLATSN